MIFSNIFLNIYLRANSTKTKSVLKRIFYKSTREFLRSAAYFCHKRFFFTFSKMPFEHVVSMNGFSKKFTGGVFRPIRKYLYVKKLLRRSLGERNTLMRVPMCEHAWAPRPFHTHHLVSSKLFFGYR